MARSKNGEAIGERGRSPSARKALRKFIRERGKARDLDEWRRGKAILGYLEGKRVVDLAAQLDVTRGSVNRWLQWYERNRGAQDWVPAGTLPQAERGPARGTHGARRGRTDGRWIPERRVDRPDGG